MASYQYIFVMQNLTKVFPGGRELFKGITLSFLPGAKIGVLGVNGAGKSTLLKIMAGVDKEFNGEAWAADGVKVGYLEQEPKLDPNKNVMENIMDGLGETRDLLKRFEEVSAKFAEPMSDDEMNALIEEQAALSEKIDACDGWNFERTIQIAMDALRCPPADADVPNFPEAKNAAWLCAVCCCRNLTCCFWTSRPTIWTPNRWPGWKIILKNIREPWLWLRTTATSWTMLPAGYWSLTAVRAFLMRGIIRPGWNRSRNVWNRKPVRKPRVRKRWPTSWNGFTKIRKRRQAEVQSAHQCL